MKSLLLFFILYNETDHARFFTQLSLFYTLYFTYYIIFYILHLSRCLVLLQLLWQFEKLLLLGETYKSYRFCFVSYFYQSQSNDISTIWYIGLFLNSLDSAILSSFIIIEYEDSSFEFQIPHPKSKKLLERMRFVISL